MIELTEVTDIDRDLDLNTAAIVVIDLQNDFCHPKGAQAIRGKSVLSAQSAAHASEQFIAAGRERGVPIFFVQTLHSDHTDSAAWMKRHRPNEPSTNCRAGTWGAEFYHVQPQPNDTVIHKHRYSAFINTRLAGLLRDTGRSKLYFAGVATGVCVESSLRDAVSLDFEATLVADCCGDYDRSTHSNALASVESGFGEVLSWKQVVQGWDHMRGT